MKTVRSDWQGVVLVCGKCSKKIGGGFGREGKTSLAKALRRVIGVKKGRRASIGIVESKCLGICPKNAVVMVNSRQPGEWLVIPAGFELGSLAERLGLDGDPRHASSPRTLRLRSGEP